MAKRLTIVDFFKKYPDEDTCLEHVFRVRYGDCLECPKCGKDSLFYRIKKRPAYACEHCGHHIYPCAGTPFENTRTPLQMWFYAIYLFTTTKHGVPAKELQRQLGVTYKTAWRMGHEIRKYMAKVDGDNGLSGHVEVDETYVGGERDWPAGSHTHPRMQKTAVFGMVQRGGDVITRVVPNARRATLFPLIERFVAKGSTISTDEWQAYKALSRIGYQHDTVNHSEKEYVRGDVHTNTLDCFWSHFKCSVRGTHRAISKKHMMKYLGEFEFRFNLRSLSSEQMLDRLLKAF